MTALQALHVLHTTPVAFTDNSPNPDVRFRNGASRIRSLTFNNLSGRCAVTQSVIMMAEALESSCWVKGSNDDDDQS